MNVFPNKIPNISSIHTRIGGKEAVTFKLVRAENVYGFNGEGRDPLRKSKIEAKVMMRDKKEMEMLCRVGGDCGGQARGDPGITPWSCRVV